MINFDSLTLKLFAQENYDFFENAKIQKIQQPNRNELIFHMRNKGESRKFYINFNVIYNWDKGSDEIRFVEKLTTQACQKHVP